MSNKVNVRVEAKWHPHASESDKQRIGYSLAKAFKRACNEAGIMHAYKEHEYYVKPSEKRRRKKRQRPDAQNNKYDNEE